MSCGKWRHKASECWQGYAQAVEEVPNSSASSVAPSAATTPAAAKTAASIQEFNDEQEPGWVLGVMGGSVASVTSGTDDLWDELVLDSGSVSTACPYAWCSDISVNNEDKVYLQDIQQRRIPSHGSWVVPLELWGPEGRAECKVKFDVADVAYPVVSLGKMIESGFTFSFDDYKCYMHKGNQRVEIFRKGRQIPHADNTRTHFRTHSRARRPQHTTTTNSSTQTFCDSLKLRGHNVISAQCSHGHSDENQKARNGGSTHDS